MTVKPIAVPIHSVRDRFVLAVWERELVGVGTGCSVQCDGLCASSEEFKCCGVARFWVVSDAHVFQLPWDQVFDAPVCPVCHPEHYLTSRDALSLIRAVAERFPEHVVVAAEEVQDRTHASVASAWRHPDDVAAIERAWVESAYWRDPLAAKAALGVRLSIVQSDDLYEAAMRQDEIAAEDHDLIDAIETATGADLDGYAQRVRLRRDVDLGGSLEPDGSFRARVLNRFGVDP